MRNVVVSKEEGANVTGRCIWNQTQSNLIMYSLYQVFLLMILALLVAAFLKEVVDKVQFSWCVFFSV